MGMLKEFRDFAVRGNVIDLAVGVIIGTAFNGIVTALINDIVMPPVGLALGRMDFKNLYYPLSDKVPTGLALEEARKLGAVIAYGNFVNVVINFVILAFIVFMMVKAMNTARKRFEQEKPAAAPAGPTPDQKLLMEIRDLLARR